ncbi:MULTISPECIES: hypothetical protein [unclassified Pseudomonas]|uniref:hypothetical protein n=1 Tax=unclassified Pseudomonas TaxID=196821 RepID=UPI0011BFE410|nr:hypothetical protein [Pseudomonas sp. MWU12-2020]
MLNWLLTREHMMENPSAISASIQQNLTGEFSATFTSDTVSGEARYPYRSQSIQNALANVAGFLDFESTSGTRPLHQSITSDYRGIRMTLKSDIVSGNHTYPKDEVIQLISYSEMQRSGTSFNLMTYKPTHAELELKITEDGRRYSGTLTFEVLIDGEHLKIESTFNVVLHSANSAAKQLRSTQNAPVNVNAAAATLQNITGEFNARFFSDASGTSIARAPYHSSSLTYDTLFLIPDINFSSQSGTLSSLNDTTSDRRKFEIHLKQGVTSGTYQYPSPGSPITLLRFDEMRWVFDQYMRWSLDIVKATLVLEVTDDRHYVAKDLSITAKTPTGADLYIKADFDIYLAWD